MKIWFGLISVMLAYTGVAQQITKSSADSGMAVILNATGDDQIYAAARLLNALNGDSVLFSYTTDRLIQESRITNDPRLLCQVLLSTATRSYRLHRSRYAIWLLDSAYRLEKRLGLELAMMGTLMNRGAMYYTLGDYYKSLSDYLASEAIMKKLNSKRVGSVYSNIALIYNDMGDLAQAEKYNRLAIPFILEQHDSEALVKVYNSLGLIEKKRKNFRVADSIFTQALKIARNNRFQQDISDLLYNKAQTLSSLKRYREAISVRQELKKWLIRADEYDWFKSLYMDLALDYFSIGEKSKAAEYMRRAEAEAWKGRIPDLQMCGYYQTMGLMQFSLGNYREAASAYAIADSLMQEDRRHNNSATLEQVKYSFEKRQDSLAFVRQQEIERLHNEKMQQENEHRLARQRILTVISVFVLLVIGVFSVFLFRANRQKDAANHQLQEQQLLITEKNKEITDSINYSLRIQQSLLPSQKKLSHFLPDHFLIYRPKDIVSGDFYWLQESGNGELFVATADCTGHGVPGAIMSALSIQQLNAMARKATEPAKILKRLNRKIREALKQGEDGASRDGLDIALCRINFKERRLTYSGANRNLWIFDATGMLREVKATKAGIAGYTSDEQDYEQHEIALNVGDTVILSTDGFADQFGGEKEKKITTRQMKEWLKEECVHSNLSGCGDALLERFLRWKNNSEQIDDVCVLGFKFV